MLRIRSIKNSHRQSLFKNSKANEASKVDYQIQCQLNNHCTNTDPHEKMITTNRSFITRSVLNRNNKLSEIKLHKTKLNFNQTHQISSNIYHSFQGPKSIDQENMMYFKINIKNINKDQERISKCLLNIAITNREQDLMRKIIKNQKISLRTNSYSYEDSIQLNMETLFSCYTQFYRQVLQKAKLKGNLYGKIIKPFLIFFKKLKNESQVIVLPYQIDYKSQKKVIKKSQIFNLINYYKPKTKVNDQIQQKSFLSENIYQRMYQKYENLPFDSIESYEKNQNELQKQLNSSLLGINSHYSIKTKSFLEQVPKIVQIGQEPNKQDKNKTQQKQVQQPLSKQNLLKLSPQTAKTSRIKQRFQDRFKKQLRQLSDDANNILKFKLGQ